MNVDVDLSKLLSQIMLSISACCSTRCFFGASARFRLRVSPCVVFHFESCAYRLITTSVRKSAQMPSKKYTASQYDLYGTVSS